MEKNKLLFKRQLVPIGARLHERLKPLGLIRLWLLVLLIGWSASASADVEPEYKNKSVTVDISGTLHYKFDFKFFNLKGDNYEWGQSTYLTVDGSSICKLNDLAYAIGTSDEGKVKTFVKNYGGKTVITKDCNISGVTDVYVTLGNPYRSGDDFYMECDVCFERNYKDKTWNIGIKGYWHYNNGTGRSVTDKIFTTNAPSVSMPTITDSNFKRSNLKIEFTYPGVSSSYSGWSNQTILYKEDNANKWKNPSYAYATYTSSGSFDVSDNYTPVTIYPRFEYYKNNGSVSTWGNTNVVRFDKDYGAITIPGQPKPKDITVSSYNTYDKSVTITWARDEYNSKTATDGKWVIFRKKTGDGSSQVRLDDVPNGTYTYTDRKGDLVYGTTYTYTVCYEPKGWNIGHESEASGLSWYVRYLLNRDFAFSNLKTEVKDGKITFSWSHNPIQDASNTKSYKLYVQRSDDDGKTWKDLRTDNITSSSTTDGSYTDANLQTHHPYQYRVKINVQDKDFESSPKTATVTTGSSLTGFSATRGNYNTSVKLTWTVNQVGTEPAYFTLQRRPLGSTNENLWADIYTTSGTSSNYSYDDNTAQPGSFNEYRLKIFDIYQGKRYEGSAMETDGFCLATGVVSGRITYGSGTAVEGAKVTLSSTNADGDAVKSNRSLKFLGSGAGMNCVMDSVYLRELMQGAFTYQLWVNPDNSKMTVNGGEYLLVDVKNAFSIYLKYNSSSKVYQIGTYVDGGTRYCSTNTYIPANKWSHITVTHSGKVTKVFVTRYDDKKTIFEERETSNAYAINWGKSEKVNNIAVANSGSFDFAKHFEGYVDEFRFFNRALTAEEVQKNYNHTLNGSEEGLQVYYPFDEGLENQTIAYDFSKQNGVSNGHHATAKVAAKSEQNVVPSDEQLSLMTYTDKDGNYMLRGIPFSGEGTSYTITPTLGVHKFNPNNESRFFNLNSLSYSGVNFEDVSSFPVSGVVYFDGTTIPVEDAMIYVDGNLAAKDGEAIKTNASGEFKVDVPIGDHFIQVKKSGHTFVNNGRYPDDPDSVGYRHTFEEAVSGLTFYDNTRVTVAGRVAGGDIEYDKPLGMRQSVANIGKAKLTLTYANSDKTYINAEEKKVGNTVSWNQSSQKRTFNRSTVLVESEAYVQAGKNKITIETDPFSGEWAAELLPLKYTVESIEIPSNKDITFTSLPDIDATNPQRETTDTLAGTDQEFKYVASAKIEYKSKSIIELTEHEDGSFGDKSITVKGLDGKEAKVDLYTVADKKVNYTFGYPVYQEMGNYTYVLHAFERYENKDVNAPIDVDLVPLANKTVKIENQYATGVSVSLEDGSVVEGNEKEFELDSLGYLVYSFTAGLPNIQSPYTRGISIAFEDNGVMIPWEHNGDFKVIVLGAISTGNNFTTQAPDQVLMVLRDPPGTGSSATYSKGTTHTDEGTLSVTVKAGGKVEAFVNAAMQIKTANGVGVAVISETNLSGQTGGSFEASASVGTNNSWSHTTVLNEEISTSTEPDFVGAPGDLFVGVSKNTIFGACHIVKVKKNEATSTATNPVYELVMEDGFSTGEQFGTTFTHSQNYIENRLIPDYEKLRDSLLIVVSDPTTVAHPAKGENPIYVTTLQKTDEKFATNNSDKTVWGLQAKDMAKGSDSDGIFRGPSYWMILPEDWKTSGEIYQDMVQFYNEQIRGWINQLKRNEEAKVLAIKDRDEYLIDNYTIDAGGTFTRATEENDVDAHSFEFTEETQCLFSDGAKMDQDGNGFEMKYEIYSNQTASTTYVNTDEKSTGFSFTIAESGDDDYLSVDVFEAPDNFGPVFYTRGGATSCPYEDEVVTKYYEPGFIISEKTVQIEKPEIEARTQLLTGIPSGGSGVFQAYIRNNSDTGEDGWYDINVVPESNPDGLVVKMDGLNITTGRSIMVKAGETMTKTFTVEQSNSDVMNYPDIQIRIASQCQKDNTGVFPEIADTTTISVYYQPACSDIKLASTHSLVNTDTETAQTLSISGYNYSMQSLRAVRLQYKGLNDADFKTLQEYTKDTLRVKSDPNLMLLPALEGTNKLNYVIDLRGSDFNDQTYVFRAITVCMQGGVEVNNESEEIEIVRDMTRPMLMATPSPASGILTGADDLLITFNEDIKGGILSKPNNFDVVGILNEGEVAHDVALSLTGNNVAKTQGTMDLSGKSFAASMWVNYSTDGQLLMHGTNDNHFTVAIEDGKLAVAVNDQKVTSTVSMPTGKWMYLNVSYDAQTSTVSAGYAKDAETVSLLSGADMPAYEGNGPVSVGGNDLTAKVQELAIWNDSRSMAQAQADMYTTKSQFTSGLIGYWQLNEGHGNVATDKARSRNMTLPSTNAWWINGDNFALTLDGTQAAAANIGALNTKSSDDYLVEAWFKADETQNGVASILSTQVMDLRLNAQGELELELNNGSAEANSSLYTIHSSLNDGQWHHVALNVLKSSNGSGIIYVDGQQCKQLAASAMPALYGDKLMLGAHRTSVDGQGLYIYDQMLKGAIDEVRIWKGRRTTDVIKNNMYNRVKADEAGLVGYYPMESFGLDSYNQIVSTATLADATAKQAGELSFYAESGTTLNSPLSTLNSQNTAALKLAPALENVQFSFVASERQIKVNLEELPAKMEGCNIYITAKNVKDINGNSADPITWSVYVQQNNLRWQESELDVTKTGAEEATFTATIENRGSESEVWTLSGMPEWLTANKENGSLLPLATSQLTFTVAEGLPIGTYETTVYLTGSQNIATPLHVTVTSEGDAPDWSATPGENTMTVVGVLKIDGVQSNDTKDMVAAFRGTECVGVAHPKYFSRYDSYMVMLSIYGKDKADLTYKAYDASTGQVYPSVEISDENAYSFAADKAVGSFKQPVMFTPLNEIEQDLSLNRTSWKWFSLYAQPKQNKVSVIFKDAADAIQTITDGEQSVMSWVGNLVSLDYAKMYKLNATAPFVEKLVGEPTNPADVDITLEKGWNWIGYPCQSSNTLDAAFASVAEEGDMVKNQTSFAIYTEGAWVGTLASMQPGDGYMYNYSLDKKTFNFPTPAISGRRNAARRANAQSPALNASFKDNMTMIAVVMNGDELVEDAEISVYAGAELRGLSTAAISNGKHFLTIGGENTEVLTYVVKTAEGEYQLQQADIFQKDAMKGSMAQPYVLQLAETTAIDMAHAGMAVKSTILIDGSGRTIGSSQKLYTKDDLKKFPAGVYFQQVTFQNGQTFVQKMTR